MTAILKLYETVDALQVVKDWIVENDELIRASEGALPDELAELLERAEIDFEKKVENVALFIRELEANALAVKSERDRLAARAKHYERAADSLRGYLKTQMEQAEVSAVKGHLATVRIAKSQASVRALLDQATLQEMREWPETMLFVKTIPETYTVDSEYAKTIWKNGGKLPAGIEVTQSTHIRIA